MKLKPLHNEILALGSIQPQGWLKTQMLLQAKNKTGLLDEIWPDIKDSAWIGGDREGWERAPYWLDGLIPLAYQLKDAQLIAKVEKWMTYIIEHQADDGWIGPVKDQAYGDKYKAFDPWPVFVYLKALLQYAQVNSDPKIKDAGLKFLKVLHEKYLPERPLFDWGKSRWADLLISVYDFYQLTRESWLLDLAHTIQQQGYDWKQHFAAFKFKEKVKDTFGQLTHVVNSAMAIKQGILWYRMSGEIADRDSIFQMLETLDTYHGQATGMFSGDEHYAGKNPSQGTETCAVVEMMYSLEKALEVYPDERLAERLERITFNALPASMSEDLKWHQYDQQVNQVQCSINENNIYTNNDPDANCFGLEPNFGCCTSNLHQGWPKFASQLWRYTEDDGLICFSYVPCIVDTHIQDMPVRIEVDGQYPFSDEVAIKVQCEKPMEFPIYLRFPNWVSKDAVLELAGEKQEIEPGTLTKVTYAWQNEVTVIRLKLNAKVELESRFNGAKVIKRGPLLFALPIKAEWKEVHSSAVPLFEVFPKSEWAYGLKDSDLDFTYKSKPLQHGMQPFSVETTPVTLKAHLSKLLNWQMEKGAAQEPPAKPESKHVGEYLELIPYGAAKLRVTEFPAIKGSGHNDS